MRQLFKDKQSFNADISAWNVGQVTDMFNMFSNAISFNQSIGALGRVLGDAACIKCFTTPQSSTKTSVLGPSPRCGTWHTCSPNAKAFDKEHHQLE